MSRNSPKHPLSIALAIASLALLLGSALAQTSAPAPAPAGSGDRQTIDNYMINHPDVAEELRKDPSLANNPQWLANHPKVQNFMNTHPNAQRLTAEHPDWAAKEVQHSVTNQVDKGEADTNRFLQGHHNMARELAKNPDLINNKEYLAQHPQLHSYLNDHPEIRNEWQAHPGTAAKVGETYHQAQVNHDKVATNHPAKK